MTRRFGRIVILASIVVVCILGTRVAVMLAVAPWRRVQPLESEVVGRYVVTKSTMAQLKRLDKGFQDGVLVLKRDHTYRSWNLPICDSYAVPQTNCGDGEGNWQLIWAGDGWAVQCPALRLSNGVWMPDYLFFVERAGPVQHLRIDSREGLSEVVLEKAQPAIETYKAWAVRWMNWTLRTR